MKNEANHRRVTNIVNVFNTQRGKWSFIKMNWNSEKRGLVYFQRIFVNEILLNLIVNYALTVNHWYVNRNIKKNT